MGTSDSCKDSTSKLNDGLCNVNDKLQSMSTKDNKTNNNISICANCGKEGSDVNNICNKCKQVRYCNAACKKKHRHKHKKECEEHIRLAADHAVKLRDEELRLAAEKHDEELFKQPPPPKEDCPICFLQLPHMECGSTYYACCGKVVCSGCRHAPLYDNQGNVVAEKKCPFCRTPAPTTKEMIKRTMKRVEVNDSIAMYELGRYYRDGLYGMSQDYNKAFELFHRATELGHSDAYVCIGYAYYEGEGVERDEKKANHYFELGAIGGCVAARHILGINEKYEGNMDRALKHYMIAVGCGLSDSLDIIKQFYSDGHATKADYTKALQLYQAYLGEIKSDQRNKAAAFDSKKYY